MEKRGFKFVTCLLFVKYYKGTFVQTSHRQQFHFPAQDLETQSRPQQLGVPRNTSTSTRKRTPREGRPVGIQETGSRHAGLSQKTCEQVLEACLGADMATHLPPCEQQLLLFKSQLFPDCAFLSDINEQTTASISWPQGCLFYH